MKLLTVTQIVTLKQKIRTAKFKCCQIACVRKQICQGEQAYDITISPLMTFIYLSLFRHDQAATQ